MISAVGTFSDTKPVPEFSPGRTGSRDEEGIHCDLDIPGSSGGSLRDLDS